MNVCKEDNLLPRNKYPEETIEKILDASLKLFLEKGYEETTVLDIVENLGGLTRGAFYHHFKSKEEVLYAIFEKDTNLVNIIFEKAKNAKVKNGLERLKLALKLATGHTSEAAGIRFNVMKLAISILSSPRFLAEHIKDTQFSAKLIEPLIAEGMADGSIEPRNPKIIAELLMLLSNIWIMPNIFPCENDEMSEKIQLIAEIFKYLGLNFLDEEIANNAIEAMDNIQM